LSPLTNASVNTLEPNIVTTQLEANEAIKAANRYLSATTAMVVMDPYEAKALMRFNSTIVLNGLSAKADTLIDTNPSLIFVSKEFVMTNGFYKDCKTVPKLAISVASEQRISTTKMFCPSVFTIDGHKFTYLQFRVIFTLRVRILYWDYRL
jgi:threonine dehydrogenase-like Zn-dependent dehydrogenase